ncbi:MAG: hypothetical protein K0R98_1202 [Rickettsiaceae bacterium]|jgi:hypothetical protein|nr:hypothetical protein [Rickettsiaceae bacterium]
MKALFKPQRDNRDNTGNIILPGNYGNAIFTKIPFPTLARNEKKDIYTVLQYTQNKDDSYEVVLASPQSPTPVQPGHLENIVIYNINKDLETLDSVKVCSKNHDLNIRYKGESYTKNDERDIFDGSKLRKKVELFNKPVFTPKQTQTLVPLPPEAQPIYYIISPKMEQLSSAPLTSSASIVTGTPVTPPPGSPLLQRSATIASTAPFPYILPGALMQSQEIAFPVPQGSGWPPGYTLNNPYGLNSVSSDSNPGTPIQSTQIGRRVISPTSSSDSSDYPPAISISSSGAPFIKPRSSSLIRNISSDRSSDSSPLNSLRTPSPKKMKFIYPFTTPYINNNLPGEYYKALSELFKEDANYTQDQQYELYKKIKTYIPDDQRYKFIKRFRSENNHLKLLFAHPDYPKDSEGFFKNALVCELDEKSENLISVSSYGNANFTILTLPTQSENCIYFSDTKQMQVAPTDDIEKISKKALVDTQSEEIKQLIESSNREEKSSPYSSRSSGSSRRY